jgi:hypothetical protein
MAPSEHFHEDGLVSFTHDAIMTPSHTSYSKYGHALRVKAGRRQVFQPATPAADLLLLHTSNKAFDTALYMQSDLSRQIQSRPFHFPATLLFLATAYSKNHHVCRYPSQILQRTLVPGRRFSSERMVSPLFIIYAPSVLRNAI